MIVATAGHVDHGKTRLVHAITGVETDRLEQERERGLTIDLGFAYADKDDVRLGFIDVPGHIRFINNMLAGVSVIDLGLLVIAADDGPMPQTREHLAILELLGISRVVVALTKTDRVTTERIDQVHEQIRSLLSGGRFHDAGIYPVSSVTGEGLEALEQALIATARGISERTSTEAFRLAIDRCFNVKGAGIVVTGSIFDGSVAIGDELHLLPRNMPVRVRALHRQNREAERAFSGDRCALNITGHGLAREHIERGNWLAARRVEATRRADAVIDVLADSQAIRNWMPVHIHSAANHVSGRLATLEGGSIAPGQSGLVQLVMSEPINLWRGDRFVVRDQSARFTLGGGRIVDPDAPRRGRARADRLERLRAMQTPDPEERFKKLLALETAGLQVSRFLDAENAGRLPGDPDDHVTAGDLAFTPANFSALETRVLDALAHRQAAHPGERGATPPQVAAGLEGSPPDELVQVVLDTLLERHEVVRNGAGYALPGHEVELQGADAEFWRKVEPVLRDAFTRPPVVHDLAKQLGLPPAAVEKLLSRCVAADLLIRPVKNRFFLPDAIEALRQQVREIAGSSADGTFSVKEFRDLTGIGRNLCIEILEYFDRTGLTLRVGDRRKLIGHD